MAGTAASPTEDARSALADLGVDENLWTGGDLSVGSPIDGSVIGAVHMTDPEAIGGHVAKARAAYLAWRDLPAPRRGEFVRRLGEALRLRKEPLARLVTLECGKSISEARGEVQEMIDICEFATGLSRQLHGLTIASERPGHRLMETWHPLGVAAIISAFNFPVAVWSWNAALALVCGNAIIWKPSEKTPLTAYAVQALVDAVAADFDEAPAHLSQVVVGDGVLGTALVDDPGVALISATGSTRMGRTVGERAARRFARTILELGGNNAAIVAPSADLDLALRGCVFAAAGAAGQRCTTLRRLFVHEVIYQDFAPRLIAAMQSIAIGDPRDAANLIGPLIDEKAAGAMVAALEEAKALGARIHGGERLDGRGVYVRPAIVEMTAQEGPMLRETFAPILYVMRYEDIDDAIHFQNGVSAGLSASIFTNDVREEGSFLSAAGADCGIVNVNLGTSGAEIGGAFGGEKETGGGRESGSDAWKGYMRRATNTINYSSGLPLAQGVEFNI